MVWTEGEERGAEQANMAGICHRDGNKWKFCLMTILKNGYDFSHFIEN